MLQAHSGTNFVDLVFLAGWVPEMKTGVPLEKKLAPSGRQKIFEGKSGLRKIEANFRLCGIEENETFQKKKL